MNKASREKHAKTIKREIVSEKDYQVVKKPKIPLRKPFKPKKNQQDLTKLMSPPCPQITHTYKTLFAEYKIG